MNNDDDDLMIDQRCMIMISFFDKNEWSIKAYPLVTLQKKKLVNML